MISAGEVSLRRAVGIEEIEAFSIKEIYKMMNSEEQDLRSKFWSCRVNQEYSEIHLNV